MTRSVTLEQFECSPSFSVLTLNDRRSVVLLPRPGIPPPVVVVGGQPHVQLRRHHERLRYRHQRRLALPHEVVLRDDLRPVRERLPRFQPRPGANCIKIGLPGKSILGYYFQENMTSRRPFLLLRISFPGRPIFIQFIPDPLPRGLH